MTAKKQRPSQGGVLPENASQRDISAFTGLSTRKIWQAKKIADIPEEEFERLVESDDPPTITQLLDMAHHRAGSKKTTWEVLVKAWNAASEEDRIRLISEATKGAA